MPQLALGEPAQWLAVASDVDTNDCRTRSLLPREEIDLADELDMSHINNRVVCVRSYGSKSRWTLARCHAMSKVFAAGLDVPMHYVIEVISETVSYTHLTLPTILLV